MITSTPPGDGVPVETVAVETPLRDPDPPAPPAAWARVGTWVALAGVLGWSCWRWRAELNPVSYLDDSSVHQQMVRFALGRLQGGHLPQTSWFPFLGLGSPHFLHYQGLPAMVAGTLGLGTGGDGAFRLTLYLLLALWPLSVYWSARLFALGRGAALMTAAAAPLLASAIGIGYEPKAYVWTGFGVWAQLWASWALPLAWAFTWRAMSSRRAVPPAAVFVALTMALHFETGYLALIPIGIFPFLAPGPWRGRLTRAAAVALGALLASAWVTVPLLLEGRWAARNEILAHTPLVNGYGAKQVLSWIGTGQLFDARRFPIVTLLGAVGLLVCLARWRRDRRGRPLMALFAMSMILSFGRTTFGPLTAVLPGGTDIFLRRFMMGIQLAGLYLVGIGAAATVQAGRGVVRRWWPRAAAWLASPRRRIGVVVATAAVGVGVLAPAWTQIDAYAGRNAKAVAVQRAADHTLGSDVDRLIGYVRHHGGGRVYAGMPSNWGSEFTVGAVPVFKYLESRDVDEVGYTLRTASLMTNPEFFFDEDDAGDYPLFAVHYLVLPGGRLPPVAARLVMSAGPYRLWVLPGSGYVRVVDTVGVLSVDRTDIGVMSVPYLRSALPGAQQYLAVAYDGSAPATPTASAVADIVGSPGSVPSEHDDLGQGQVTATVVARRRAAVVLSASFDPGWTVRVDGHRAPVVMLAPALPAVEVGPGRHEVSFSYGGFGLYPELFAVLVLTVGVLVWAVPFDGWRRMRGRRA